MQTVLGIIGGSGVYDHPGLENATWTPVHSPWGEPSDALRVGDLEGQRVVFLPRHGRGHRLSPSGINYRANIDAMKRAGVTDIISISACGSFREHLPPGAFVLVDQFIDKTCKRETSFFGNGLVAHVSMAHPVAVRLQEHVEAAASAAGGNIQITRGGTYLCMEGPQFSSLAESTMYRQWGCDVIGMTAMPEVKLAREAEIPYACVAMVTDFDCWHPGHDAVQVTDILDVMHANAARAIDLVTHLARGFPRQRDLCPSGADTALDTALITAPDARDPFVMAKLDAVAGRVLTRNAS